jgi:hypothetical protein
VDDSLDKYKVRLVAKGFTQQSSVNFVDTYSPVANFASIRITIPDVARMNVELHQLDLYTAFLNGQLKVYIYMSQPEVFQVKRHKGKVYKLKIAMYGLNQTILQAMVFKIPPHNPRDWL